MIKLLTFVLMRNQKQPLHPVRPCRHAWLGPHGALAGEKVLSHGAPQLAVDLTDRECILILLHVGEEKRSKLPAEILGGLRRSRGRD